jgi:hypothetical protein
LRRFLVADSGQSLCGTYSLHNARTDILYLVTALEDCQDAWGLADGSPEVAVVVLEEEVAREQRDADEVAAWLDPAGCEREVGAKACSGEIGLGPAFCLAVGLDDAPIAAARQAVPSGEWCRFGRI